MTMPRCHGPLARLAGWTVVLAGLAGTGCERPKAVIPITTASDAAREAFLQGRESLETLEADSARAHFERAIELDPGFAMAHLYLARTLTGPDAAAALRRAVAQVDNASDGERRLVLAEDAGAKGRSAERLQVFAELVRLYPDDARAWTELGRLQLDGESTVDAIGNLENAVRLDPALAPAWDLLGRARWRRGEIERAEEAFGEAAKLLPARPEPLAARGELLMKAGAFDAAGAGFEAALALDPHFGPAQIGLATGLILQDRADEARRRLQGFHDSAGDDAERRRALRWTALSHVFERHDAEALAALERARALSAGDAPASAEDLNLTGDVRLDAGDHDGALAAYAEAFAAVQGAEVPQSVKDRAAVERIYREVRVALDRGDRRAAREKSVEFRQALRQSRDSDALLLSHELSGLLELTLGHTDEASRELARADTENPRVLYLTALVHAKAGYADRARRFAEMAANFNAPHPEYAFVRDKARRLLAGE
jgi:tetratricopeptide (TPR) repeat protein